MSTRLQPRPVALVTRTSTGESSDRGGTAARASAQVDRAGGLLGALGLGSSLFVVFRLVQTWQVNPDAASHRISILDQNLSYPAVNLAAVAVLALALLGLAATVMMAAGAWRELAASRRLGHRLRALGAPRELGGAIVIADEHPRAFCAGLLRPRVYISTGAVAMLDEAALSSVLAHEQHHARRRDPLRLAGGRVITRALFFLPSLRQLILHQQRLAELSADESAMNADPESRSALARAMLSFSERSRPGDPAGIDPERVDHLLGEPVSWRFPLLLCVLTVSVLALLVAVGVLAGQVASGSATLAPPFLSRQPCVMVLATIPALVAFVSLRIRR